MGYFDKRHRPEPRAPLCRCNGVNSRDYRSSNGRLTLPPEISSVYKARTALPCPLKDVLPIFGTPQFLQADNVPPRFVLRGFKRSPCTIIGVSVASRGRLWLVKRRALVVGTIAQAIVISTIGRASRSRLGLPGASETGMTQAETVLC